MDRQRITAQLGCGALILVIIAAYLGATAGTERLRAPAEGAAEPQPLPPIFREGNLVTMVSLQTTGVTGSPVMRVLDVRGTWVQLRVDVETSAPRLEGYAGAGEEQRSQMIESLKNSTMSGDWWINLAVTDLIWSEFDPSQTSP
jgi:hypothetical protein